MEVNYYKFALDKITVPSVNLPSDGVSGHCLFPLSLQIKSGGEALLDPTKKFIFSAGVGFAPGFAISMLYVPDVTFKLRPFLMTEVGVYAGIAFKARISYYPSVISLVNVSDYELPSETDSGSSAAISAFGTGNVIFSLIFMPYSNHWEEDTY